MKQEKNGQYAAIKWIKSLCAPYTTIDSNFIEVGHHLLCRYMSGSHLFL